MNFVHACTAQALSTRVGFSRCVSLHMKTRSRGRGEREVCVLCVDPKLLLLLDTLLAHRDPFFFANTPPW